MSTQTAIGIQIELARAARIKARRLHAMGCTHAAARQHDEARDRIGRARNLRIAARILGVI